MERPLPLGAPDGIVVNMTPERAWVREGILPAYPNNRAPQFDMSDGNDFVVPHPRHSRKDIQQQEIRDLEVDPKLYYPEGYHPKLLTEWPGRLFQSTCKGCSRGYEKRYG